MKLYYRCSFGMIERRHLNRDETLINERFSPQESYHGVALPFEQENELLRFCDGDHPGAPAIAKIRAIGSTLVRGLAVFPIDDAHVAFAVDCFAELERAELYFGRLASLQLDDLSEERRFAVPIGSEETALARIPLLASDEPACKACGSRRLFCERCLAFASRCADCGAELKKSAVYDSVNESRKRRGIEKLALYEECVLASEDSPDLAVSALPRKISTPKVYYSVEAFEFIRRNVRCRISVTPVRSIRADDYRGILQAIGALP